MPRLEFSEERHEYRLDNKILPSVTQVLAPLYNFDHVPADVLEHKRQIGNAVHKAVELSIHGTLDHATVDPAVQPYFDAWNAFRRLVHWDAQQTEVRVSHPAGYAGTADLVVRVDGLWWLLDIKSCASVSPAVALQTAAYARAYESTYGVAIARRFALQLKPNGKPCVTEYQGRTDFAVFQSLLNVFNWRQQHG